MKRVILGLLISLWSISLFATAIDQTNIGIRATGLGGAFTGVADDSSAVFWNAAGLAFYEGKGEVNAGIYLPYMTVKNEIGTGSFEGKTTESKVLNTVPSFFAVYKLTDDMALGFGFYFPYGGGKIDFENAYDYDSRAASAYPNVNENLFDITKDFRAYTFTLSGAYKISDILSVGAGLSLYYVTLGIQTENKLVNVPTSGPLAGYGIYGKTDQFISGMGVSGNFGIMLKPVQGLSLGLSTRLPFSVKLEGDFKIKDSYALDGSGNVIPGSSGAADSTNDSYKKISAPWSIGFGVGYQVTAKWLVSMDVEYQMWDQADEIKSKNTESSSEETNSYGWENTLRFGLGTEYMLTPALALLGGFKIAPSAPQDGYYGLDNVDLTAYALFLGLGYDITESIKVEGGFSYVYYPDKTQDSLEPSDTDPATPAPLVGEMEKNIMGGGIQVKYLF